MTIDENIQQFAGLPIQQFSPGATTCVLQNVAVRLEVDWDAHDSGASFESIFSELVADPKCADITALVIGDWAGAAEGNDSEPVVEALVSARDKLPHLRAIFLGEMTVEECEISWIQQSDVSPLFEAFPHLEELCIRGGTDLSLGRPRHARLRKLVIETGGMSGNVVREVASADLPALQHLELWLGDDGYGNDVSAEDISELLSKGPVGQLRYLGLRDDCRADDTARLLVEHGIPASLEILDLSLGTLGDQGANSLAAAPWLPSLKKLDIHHHYLSFAALERLQGVVTELDAAGVQEPDEDDGESYRYVAVSE